MNSNQFLTEDVDDIFVLFESAEHLSKFHAYLTTCHPDMSMYYMSSKYVSRHQGKIVTTVYTKPAFTGVYAHFVSFSLQITKLV